MQEEIPSTIDGIGEIEKVEIDSEKYVFRIVSSMRNSCNSNLIVDVKRSGFGV
jgi:hypothetical protein